MDLSEEQRYASAALFTLALHSTQVDAGCGRVHIKDKARPGWGEPSPQVLDHFYEGREDHPELDSAAWDSFWGWDCCGPNGLLDRVYRQLELPPRTWSGLKKLPEVAYGDSFQEFMDLVRTYLAVLDTTLPMPIRKPKKRRKKLAQVLGRGSYNTFQNGEHSVSSKSANDLQFSGAGGHLIIRGKTDEADRFEPAQPIHKLLAEDDSDDDAEREVRDDLFSDILNSDKDSDLEDDLQRDKRRTDFEQSAGPQPGDTQGHVPLVDMYALLNRKVELANKSDRSDGEFRPWSPQGPPVLGARVALALVVKQRQEHLLDEAEDYVVADMQVVDCISASIRGGGVEESEYSPRSSICTEAPDVAALSAGPRGPSEPSRKALAAMWELLEGCLALAHPELEVEVQEAMMQRLDQKLAQEEAKKGKTPLVVSTAQGSQAARHPQRPPSPPTPNLHSTPSQPHTPSAGTRVGHGTSAGGGGFLTVLPVGSHSMGLSSVASMDQEDAVLLSQHGPASDAAAPAQAQQPKQTHAAAAAAVSVEHNGEAVSVTMMPRVRWYDARARIALKRLSAWLFVPWSRVQNFEMLLAYQVETGEKQRPTINLDNWTKSKRWATIAAVAVAGGGAFALVGAMVMMPLFVFAFPTVAFFSSAGGMAAVTSAMAALGLADAGSRASRRTQLSVKEFGFMEVVPPANEPKQLSHAGSSTNVKVGVPEGSGHSKTGGADGQTSGQSKTPLDSITVEGAASEMGGDRDGTVSEDGSMSSYSTLPRKTECSSAVQTNGHQGDLDPGHLTLTAGAGGYRGPPRRPSAGGTASSSSAVVQPSASSSRSLMRWFSSSSSSKKGSTLDEGKQLLEDGSEASTSQATSKPETAKQARAREQAEWNKMKKDDLLEMPLSKRRRDDLKLGVVIGVNGWIAERIDFLRLWRNLRPADAEVYTLVWESRELIALNYALTSFLTTQVAQQVAQRSAALMLGPVVAAVAPAITLNTATGLLIDNAWAVMVERSMKAGKLLAHTLMTGGHGDRPVVLIGYSMGARLVFHCLLELCRHKCKGIVEHAVMLGNPVGVRPERWRMARSVVSGRFVNGYSKRDWVLQVVYRTSKGFTRAAGGLGPVMLPGVENVNLTGLIDGHFSYISNIDEIMELINLWPAD